MLGAGRALGSGGDDFSWMNAWRVRAKESSKSLRGDALVVEKLEAAGGLVSWDGRAYRWSQEGD